MIRLISFADKKYRKAAKRLKEESELSNQFDKITIYTEKNFDADYLKQYGNFISNNPRGYGYWIWKPYIVNKEFEDMAVGDILVYVDAGCAINWNQKRKFKKYIGLLENSSKPFLAFSNGYLEKEWDKGDCIDALGCRNNKDVLETEQIMAGIWIVKKNVTSSFILKTWFEIIHSNLNLVDDSSSRTVNEVGFKENRHDQTIFSLLLKKNDVAVILPSTEVEVEVKYRNQGWQTYRRYWKNFFLAIRDRKGILYYKDNFIIRCKQNILCDFKNLKQDFNESCPYFNRFWHLFLSHH